MKLDKYGFRKRLSNRNMLHYEAKGGHDDKYPQGQTVPPKKAVDEKNTV